VVMNPDTLKAIRAVQETLKQLEKDVQERIAEFEKSTLMSISDVSLSRMVTGDPVVKITAQMQTCSLNQLKRFRKEC